MSWFFSQPPHLDEFEVRRILNSMVGPRSRDRGGFTHEDADKIMAHLLPLLRQPGDDEGLTRSEILKSEASLRVILPTEAHGPLRQFIMLLLEALEKKKKESKKAAKAA